MSVKIFDGQSVDSLSVEEMNKLRYSVSTWYFGVSFEHDHRPVEERMKDQHMGMWWLDGRLSYMDSLGTMPPVFTVAGESLHAFGEYELPTGAFVYVVWDTQGNVWQVLHVERVNVMTRRPVGSGEEFAAEQWAASLQA
jgi:hypothetical protein